MTRMYKNQVYQLKIQISGGSRGFSADSGMIIASIVRVIILLIFLGGKENE